jgi:rhodanese-related sulfurtransferase
VCTFTTATKICRADESNSKSLKAASAKRGPRHPHCGLYCLYTAMKLAGQKIDFRELVKPEYIGSRKGSSLAELQKAAVDNGLYAVQASKLTAAILRNCPHPVILHVKAQPTSRRYDHYELFLGMENGQAKLLNPPGLLPLAPLRELAARWDGSGLIISKEPIQLGPIFAPARKRLAAYAAAALAIILIARWGRRWFPQMLLNSSRKLLALSVAQGAALGIAALLVAFIYHFATDEGFLARADATSSIQQAHLANFIPKINADDAGELLDSSDAVFVDARYARDFEAGHLEGAISIPVDADESRFKNLTSQIGSDAQIVVYCQSAGCRFAEKVAVRLMEEGFSNVSIFKGGWRQWQANNSE